MNVAETVRMVNNWQRRNMITRGSGEFEATVTVEFEVRVKYKGYHDPGRLSGPPEDCYPPEGEVEIEVIGLPAGVNLSEDETIRLDGLAFEHLRDDPRRE